MPELTTEVPQTGTRLLINNDRQFDRQEGDSVLRVQGQSQDGGQVLDAAYVEVNPVEANLIAQILRGAQNPTPQTEEWITNEIYALFPAKLSARDANQIAKAVVRAQYQAMGQKVGIGDESKAEKVVSRLAERFERAAAQRSASQSMTGNGSDHESGKKH